MKLYPVPILTMDIWDYASRVMYRTDCTFGANAATRNP